MTVATIIMFNGETSVKQIDGKACKITPFIGASARGINGELGIGYVTENGAMSFRGVFGPRDILQSWRAMKIFEQMPVVNKETLDRCYSVAGTYLDHLYENPNHKPLAADHGNADDFASMISVVKAAVPHADHMHEMLQVVKNYDVYVPFTGEMEKLLGTGALKAHPVLDQLRKVTEDARAAMNEPYRPEVHGPREGSRHVS